MNTTPARRCRVLRLALTATIALGAWSAKAEKVQVWAKGVTAESGWENTFQFSNGCWAGCATDMIDWWQKRIAEKYDYSGIKVWDREELIRQYDVNPYFGDGGEYVWRALEWVFTNTIQNVSLYNPGYQYLTNLGYSEFQGRKPIFYVLPCYESDTADVEKCLEEFVDANGNCIASIRNSSHAYTLYGVEYEVNEQGEKTFLYLYITDPTPTEYEDSSSPHYKKAMLHQVKLYYHPNYQGRPRIYGSYWITKDQDGAVTAEQCPVDPFEFTYLRIDDELLVDSEGNPSFKLLGGGDGDTPAFDPIRPGVAARFDSQTQADAFVEAFGKDKPSFVTPPDGLPASFKARYAGLFEAKRRDLGDGKFAVDASLTAEARAAAQKQVDDWRSLDLPQVFSTGGGKFATTPGLYYSALAGETPNDLTVRSTTLATGETLELTFPKLSTTGFYRVKATVSAETVHTDL